MSSIGKDLILIRKHLGLSIQDIQSSTKIPLNTLEAIESGVIFEQSDEIKTYVRSFVRSYGRAIKLDDELVVTALDQQEAGNYNHVLLSQFPALEGEKQTKVEKADLSEAKTEPSSSKFVADFPEEEPEVKPEFKPAPSPGVRNVNWADLGNRFSTKSQKTPVWIIGASVILIVAVVVLYFLVESDVFSGESLDIDQPPVSQESIETPSAGNELSLELSDSPPPAGSVSEVLADTLFLTVYAAYGQLEPVRVWSDLKPRVDPYWIENRIALNFEFADTIRVRGQYSRMLLFLNGHRVDNFRQQYFNPEENAVELTRDLFESDPKWSVQIPFELPENANEPDSVANRPTF